MSVPAVFMNHGGGPMPLLGEPSHVKLTESMRSLPSALALNTTLKAILVISAHWEAPNFNVITGNNVPLLFDYSGFPPESYKFQYTPPGAQTLAEDIVTLLNNHGIASKQITIQDRKGYDHGVFVPLMCSFPKADVPVVQLSLKQGLDAAEHIAVGQILAPLRDQGVLLYGSGMSYHNMRNFMGGSSGNEESVAFDTWLHDTLSLKNVKERLEQLSQWEKLAPAARRCHPREEHLAPLFVIAGAGSKSDDVVTRTFSGEVLGQKVSSFAFGGGSGGGLAKSEL